MFPRNARFPDRNGSADHCFTARDGIIPSAQKERMSLLSATDVSQPSPNPDFTIHQLKPKPIGSAGQIVPKITPHTKSVTQFMRSAQWMMPRPTPPLFGSNEAFAKHGQKVFKYIPFMYPVTRFLTFLVQESLFLQFKSTKTGERERQKAEKEILEYMKATAPEKYHDLVLPKFKLGCKVLAKLHWNASNIC